MHDLLVPGIAIGEKLLRTAVVYGFLLLGLRVAGKRELSQVNAFDLVVLLLLSNTLQNAIIGNDNSLSGGLIGAAALLIINSVVVRTLFHYRKLDVLEGKPDTLIRCGHVLHHHLEREMITLAELAAAARRQGIPSLAHVDECRLETGGALTFIARQPTTDDVRHHELLAMLSQLDARQRALADQIAALEHAPTRASTAVSDP
jgi:uncharacterized membrane protein YcaP (DUF421 family)